MKAILIDAKLGMVREIEIPNRESALSSLKVKHRFRSGDIMLAQEKAGGPRGFMIGSGTYGFKTIYGSAIVLS